MADVHVFDEAQDVAATLEAPRHRQDLVLIDAALDHHVDLHRCEPGLRRRFDPGENLRHRKIDVVHRPEHLIVERIETYRDPAEPGALQGGSLGRQRGAIGGQRQIETTDAGEHGDQVLEVSAQERFAAG